MRFGDVVAFICYTSASVAMLAVLSSLTILLDFAAKETFLRTSKSMRRRSHRAKAGFRTADQRLEHRCIAVFDEQKAKSWFHNKSIGQRCLLFSAQSADLRRGAQRWCASVVLTR